MILFFIKVFGRKRLLLTFLSALLFIPSVMSQTVNALFLKDGSKVLGYVMQLDSLGSIRIQSTDGKMLSYQMSDIDNIIWSYRQKEPGPGPIYRYGDVFCWKYNDMELSDKNYDRYFDVDLYHDYIVGRNQFNIGGAGLVLGVGSTLLAALSFDPSANRQNSTFVAYTSGACVLFCIGGIYTYKGIRRLNQVEKTFNERQAGYEASNHSSTLNSISLNPTLLLTTRNDLALGASVSLSF